MVYVKKKLALLSHDEIQAHILDPEKNPLPEHQKEQFDRVLSAARLLDDYPDDNQLIKLLQYKYNCGETFTLYEDEGDSYNYEKGIYSTIAFRWNNAKKTLQKIIGDKPEGLEDPNRMGNNQFFIQVNIGGKTEYKPISEVHELRPDEVKEIFDIMQQPITDEQAAEIMDS